MLGASSGWLHTAIALAAFAGLRQGEVRALEARDVDLSRGIITVRRALSESEAVAPKSGHERVVPIGSRLAEVLHTALRDKLPAARLVVNQKGRTPSRQAVWTGLHAMPGGAPAPRAELSRSAPLLPVGLGEAVPTSRAVRELAGHSKLQTTQRYFHATGADLRDAIAKLPG